MSYDSSVDRVAHALDEFVAGVPAGTQLPSSRALIAELGVSATTVQQALTRLVGAGTVVTRPGAGSFVAPSRVRVEPDTGWQAVALGASPVNPAGLEVALRPVGSDVLPMAVAYLGDELRPDARLSAALARAARRPGVWARPPSGGVPELRAWFATQLGVAPQDVLITPGGQAAVSAILRAIVPAGEQVLLAAPTYPGALAVARSAGIVPVPVPTDADGVRPDLLERAWQRTGARLLYLQPSYANPDGSVLAPHRRAEVLALARRFGAFILEDDWARWLSHRDPTPPPLIRDDEHGHVLTVCSLTKVIAPGLRIGAVIARGPVAGRVAATRLVDDFYVSGPLQHAAVELVTAPAWAGHLRTVGAGLEARCAALTTALASALPDCAVTRPRGGMSVWLELPDGLDDLDIAQHALAAGVAVNPGSDYTVGEQTRRHLRICFATVELSQIPVAVERLRAAVAAARA